MTGEVRGASAGHRWVLTSAHLSNCRTRRALSGAVRLAQGDAQVGLRLGSGNLDSDGGAEWDPELGNHSASRAPSAFILRG